jgi:hypothetical protein
MTTPNRMTLGKMARGPSWLRLAKPYRISKDWILRQLAERRDRRNAKSIERTQGKVPHSLRRQADEYARDVLGHRKHAWGLCVFTAVHKSFREGWIPQSYYREHVMPVTYRAGELNRYRHLLRMLLPTAHVPDIAYVFDGRFYNLEFVRLAPGEAREALFGQRDTVIFKRNRSARGRGVCKVRRDDFDAARLEQLPDGVFQEIVSPHEVFSDLLPDRGPTIRILTVRGPDGTVTHRGSYLRIARQSMPIVEADTQVGIAIQSSTGLLQAIGYSGSKCESVAAHPDTGCRFEGFVIPGFAEAANEMVNHHRSFPLSDVIGWDVCIDRHGQPQILEWNLLKAGVEFLQATHGPIFRGLGWENYWK